MQLTEFEGAILMEVGRQPGVTAFQVRRAFEASPSSIWSNSAGAVYTAVNRLIDAGLLNSTAPLDARRTRQLKLTSAGRKAHGAWAKDLAAASAIGSDPFRLRAPGWRELPKKERSGLLAALQGQLEREIAHLVEMKPRYDPHDQVRAVFAIDLQRSRLAWVRSQRKRASAR
jgi:DNA-binding MarR family transcriptional regulator